MLRKTLIIMVQVFLSQYSDYWKILLGVLVCCVMLRVFIFLKPYKSDVNNELEYYSMLATMITIFGGIIYIDEDSVAFVEVITFLLIAFINIVFLIFWIYLMTMTFPQYKAAQQLTTLFRIILFRRGDDRIVTDDEPPLSNLQLAKSRTKTQRIGAKLKTFKESSDNGSFGQECSSPQSKIMLKPDRKSVRFSLMPVEELKK